MTIIKSRSSIEEAALLVCKMWATERSKDPSTKVGACVYDPHSGGLFLGYNGFPVGVPDDDAVWNRKQYGTNEELVKYDLVIHAETNAVRKALLAGVNLKAATLICTHIPCPQCMKDVVLGNQIHKVVYQFDNYPSRTARETWVVKEMARLGSVWLDQVADYSDARNEALEKKAGAAAIIDSNKPHWCNPLCPDCVSFAAAMKGVK